MTAMMTVSLHQTWADCFRPAHRGRAIGYNMLLVLGGSLLLAASAQLMVPVPFSPVPVTAQTFAVLLLGALLGPTLGVAAVLAYLAQGLAGLPVFAGGIGAAALLGPTGGYLVGFIPGVWLTGIAAQRGWDRQPIATAAAMVAGCAAIFACGMLWLGMYLPWSQVVASGLLPFLPGEVAKIALATAVLPTGWRVLQWLR